MRNRLILSFSLAVGAMISSTQNASADQVCRPCPFDCQRLQISRDDCDNRGGQNGYCCVDLDNRGKDQLRDFDRFSSGYGRGREDDRRHWDDRHRNSGNGNGWNGNGNGDGNGWNGYGRNDDWRRRDPGSYDDRNGYQPGDCPVGYHVNDRPCNSEEARQGCRDTRSRSNQICVGWNVLRR